MPSLLRSQSRPCLLALAGLALAATPLRAATLPTGFAETQVASGLANPTAMAIAPDGRIFVCLQGGSLRVVKNGALLATPFHSFSVNSSGERGLLGVAFDPDFAANQFVYVYYTTSTSPIHNRISRLTAIGDVSLAGSETVLVDLDNLSSATNHNGGALHFGPDGKLYVAVGENATPSYAQTLSNRHGKMLRYNPDGTIPTDNPFYGTATGANRSIWTLGLRNPFTFNFQPGTGRMFINDVGAGTWEEINDGLPGANYGWPTAEGEANPSNPSFTDPLYAYGHGGGACAITGGAFYDPAQPTFPADHVGKYFFADYCASWIRRLDPATAAVTNFATNAGAPVDLQVSDEGDLYYLSRGSSALFRVRYTASQAPSITTPPANRTVTEGQPASFTVTASGTAPLAYQWQRGGAPISGATAATYTLAAAQLSDDGAQFRCVVSNAFGSATSAAAILTVTANRPPVPTITSPAAGALYTAGQTMTYSGTGSDPEDGTLTASRFTWRVDFHHDAHFHPFIPDTPGVTGGTFVVPTSGETAANVWYRIHLTVRDSAGLTGTTFRDILPRTAIVTLATSRPGLGLLLDGSPVTAPSSFTGVAGIVRSLEAPSPQALNGTTWVFASWSDAGARAHTLSTPATNTTYTATFAKARAQITSPAPGSTLAPSVTFAWGPGTGVTRYQLELGTSPAGTDLYAGVAGTATSAAVTGLPTDGRVIYARLWSEISGAFEYEDYTYAASVGGPSLAVSATTVTPGAPIQITVAGGPGNRTDWIGLFASAAGDTTYLDWKYLNGTRTAPASGLPNAIVTFAMPAVPGTYNLRLFANNSYSRIATSVTVTVGGGSLPTLSVSSTQAPPGGSIDVTVAGGPGNPTDWVSMSSVSATDTAFADWKYLNGTRTAPATGLTAATLSFAMPTTPGTYNFRFFANNSFARLAQSVTVTVTAGGGPTLTVSAATVAPGAALQVTIANGLGNRTDWIGLHAVSGIDTALLDWKYLSGTRTAPASGLPAATVTFTMPSTPGTYNFRLFANNSYARVATSATVTVTSEAPAATLAVSATTVARGATVQVTVANDPGNQLDWIGLHTRGAADTAVIDWKYLNGSRTPPASGSLAATVGFTMPASPGVYEFRLFLNNGYSRLAVSEAVQVQ